MDVVSATRLQALETEQICIGCDVWLGSRVAVLRGAEIGDGVIVGVNTLVLFWVLPARVVCMGGVHAVS